MAIVRLKTDRLLLREVMPSDTQQIFESWFQDKDVSKYMWWEASSDIADVQKFMDFELQNVENEKWNRWVIVPEWSEKIIGTCLLFFNEDEGHWDISYNLRKDSWGYGFATEAMRAVMRYAIGILNIDVVYTSYAAENERSGNVLKKLGFEFVKEIPYVCNGGKTVTKGICCKYEPTFPFYYSV